MSKISGVAENVTLGPPSYYNTVTIALAAVVSGSGNAIYGGTEFWYLINNGAVQGGTGWGIDLARGGEVENRATGRIAGAATGGQAGGLYIAGPFAGVYNAGSIDGGTGVGISLAASGTVENDRGGLITGALAAIEIADSGANAVVNRGDIASSGQWGVRIDGHGYVFNRPGATITSTYAAVSMAGGPGTVGNGGVIVAAGTGASYGIVLGDGGDVTNTMSGSIQGGTDGLLGQGHQPLSLLNDGTISGTEAGAVLGAGGYVDNAAGGLIVGATGLEIAGRPAFVSNAGTMRGTAGIGLHLTAGGIVTNDATGRITGSGGGIIGGGYGGVVNAGVVSGGSGDGLYFGFGGTITNRAGGSITGAAGIAIARTSASVMNGGEIRGTSGDGVRVTGGGTVVNAGTIAGSGVAVYFGGFLSCTLVIDPRAVFDGTVMAATTEMSYLQLGSGSPASIAGLGTQFQGFAALKAEHGSDWSLQGANTVGNLTVAGTIEVAGGSLVATGSLTGAGVVLADPGSTIAISGYSTWAGTIDLSQSAIMLAGSLGGHGTIDIGAMASATLQQDVGGSVGIDFTASAGSLDLGAPRGFHGTIDGFATGDSIALLATSADSAVFGNGTLTVSEGKATVALLHFAGTYAANAFTVSSDSHGDTLLMLHA